MDDCEKCNKISLPDKDDFYSHSYMEDITYADYTNAKRVNKDFKIYKLWEYRDLHVQSNPLLLVDVFEKFWKICLEMYEFDPACFLTAPRLAWQAALKRTKVKWDFLTDTDLLLMVKKGIKGGNIMLFIGMWKIITCTWKLMINKKSYHISNIGT